MICACAIDCLEGETQHIYADPDRAKQFGAEQCFVCFLLLNHDFLLLSVVTNFSRVCRAGCAFILTAVEQKIWARAGPATTFLTAMSTHTVRMRKSRMV